MQLAYKQEVPTRALAALVAWYVIATLIITWALWGLSYLLLTYEVWGETGSVLAGVLQVLGTLVPPCMVYALFPRLEACGLIPAARRLPEASDDEESSRDSRAGFWHFVFGGGCSIRGWIAFAVLMVWRWIMFRVAFGFPETPGDALMNALTNLPLLFLGGGFEEIGWRGLLQPALKALLERIGRSHTADEQAPRSAVRPVIAALIAPFIVGIIWAVWHLPLFVMPGALQNGMAFVPFMGVAIALSYSFGALRTFGDSLLHPICAHAWYNAMVMMTLQFSWISWLLFTIEGAAGAVVLALHAYRGALIPDSRQS